MRSRKNGSNHVPPTSSSPLPPQAEPQAPEFEGDREGLPNAFDAAFLDRLEQQEEEPPTAPEAELAGPWRVEPLPEKDGGGFGLYREGESWQRRFEPFARFDSLWTARLVAALLPGLARDAAYRFREEKEEGGWAIESREAWGAVIGHVQIFDPALLAAMQVADGLMRSPRELASFLEVCGLAALEKAGAILEARSADQA